MSNSLLASPNTAQEALQNSVTLQQLFNDAVSPTANFFAENRKLAIEKEKMLIAQRNRLAEISLSHQYAQQEQAQREAAARASQTQSEQAALGLTRETNTATAAREHANTLLGQQFVTEQNIRAEAEKIRADPQARRYMTGKMSDFKDDAEGNKALITAYHQGVAANGEKLDTEDVAAYTKKAIEIVKDLASTSPGSPQATLAVQQFLGQPGVADTLIRKGKFTEAQIQALANSGNPGAVYAAIAKAGQEASWVYGSDDKVVSNLTSAWMEALSNNKVLSPGQQIQADLLKSILARRDAIFAQGNISSPESLQKIADAAGLPKQKSPADILKDRDAAAQGAVIPQAVIKPRDVGLANPFGQVPQGTPNQLGILPAVNGAGTGALSSAGLNATMSGNDPFTPRRLAADPATDFAIRKQVLDSQTQNVVNQHAAIAGLTGGYINPDTNAVLFDQAQKENQLKSLVMSLYTPKIDVSNPGIAVSQPDPVSAAPYPADPVSAAPYPKYGPTGPF